MIQQINVGGGIKFLPKEMLQSVRQYTQTQEAEHLKARQGLEMEERVVVLL
tara:strand:- start:867 stop:1019 length:153 start_codon:yes stop_codon:yes gene_type:complete